MDISDFDPDRSWIITQEGPFNSIWYIGTVNSIRKGLDLLFDNLNYHGHILIEDPIIFDYADFLSSKYGMSPIYVILYKSLPKLEYLEYKYKEQVDKNEKKLGV
jgi:hypothetical protein